MKKVSRGASVSNSFSRAQVKALNRLFQSARAGADIKLMLQTPPLVELQAKFQKMEARAEEIAAEMKSEGNARRANMDAAAQRVRERVPSKAMPVRGTTEPDSEPHVVSEPATLEDLCASAQAYGADLAATQGLVLDMEDDHILLQVLKHFFRQSDVVCARMVPAIPAEERATILAAYRRAAHRREPVVIDVHGVGPVAAEAIELKGSRDRPLTVTVTVARKRFGALPEQHVVRVCREIARRMRLAFTDTLSVAVCTGDSDSVSSGYASGDDLDAMRRVASDIIESLWEAGEFKFKDDAASELRANIVHVINRDGFGGSETADDVSRFCQMLADKLGALYPRSVIEVETGLSCYTRILGNDDPELQDAIHSEAKEIGEALWESGEFWNNKRADVDEEDEKPTSLEEDGEAAAEDMSHNHGFGDDDGHH